MVILRLSTEVVTIQLEVSSSSWLLVKEQKVGTLIKVDPKVRLIIGKYGQWSGKMMVISLDDDNVVNGLIENMPIRIIDIH